LVQTIMRQLFMIIKLGSSKWELEPRRRPTRGKSTEVRKAPQPTSPYGFLRPGRSKRKRRKHDPLLYPRNPGNSKPLIFLGPESLGDNSHSSVSHDFTQAGPFPFERGARESAQSLYDQWASVPQERSCLHSSVALSVAPPL